MVVVVVVVVAIAAAAAAGAAAAANLSTARLVRMDNTREDVKILNAPTAS